MAVRSVNVEVKPKYENENIERMLRRFTKKCKKERIIENFRDRMRYEKPSVTRKKEKARRKKVLEKLRIEREKKLN
jgi:small subunit ribosomal protein S21